MNDPKTNSQLPLTPPAQSDGTHSDAAQPSSHAHYEKITTKDGSTTLYNAEYKQTYHSTSGAYEEAVEKYVKPCGIQNGTVILDYCFGPGYNTLAALAIAQNLTIVALENDATLLMNLHELIFDDDSLHELYQQLVRPIRAAVRRGVTDFQFSVGTSKVRLIVGDAREKLRWYLGTTDRRFDAIFFDPFSPKECPQLWTKAVFLDCYTALKPGTGVLATYSCAGSVRRAMVAAGFTVKDGPSIGRRAPSTLAYRQ